MRFTRAKRWSERYASCGIQIDERRCVLRVGGGAGIVTTHFRLKDPQDFTLTIGVAERILLSSVASPPSGPLRVSTRLR
jgi:hypothetical protein